MMSSKDTKEKYCICRSSDSKSFMIACESCDEWFHGKCIKITPDGASNIRKYYCEACREKDSSLSIKYRKPKRTPAPKPSKQKYTKRRKTEENKGDGETLVQCYGPQCVNAVRADSKYCSDSCGLKLAAMRLSEIMPSRLQQWQQSTCVAEKKDKEVLADIKKKQQECQARIQRLAERHKVIDEIVERGKKLTVSKTDSSESEEENDESSNDEEEELELYIHCVTCGHEIRQVSAVKHIERCYAKAEKDMLFESHIKSPGNYICDHYNTSSKSYCKKLKQICPEHAKDGKILDSEVCGCPLVNDIYSDKNKTCDLCTESKKHCNKHYRWERLRRAEIDGEIVREYYRWEELAEKERIHTASIANRGGVMSLMLHQTVDHDALNAQHARQLHKITPSKPERPDSKPAPGPAAKVIVVGPPNKSTNQKSTTKSSIPPPQPNKNAVQLPPPKKNVIHSQSPIIPSQSSKVVRPPNMVEPRPPIIIQPRPPKIVLPSIIQTSGGPRKPTIFPVPKNITQQPTISAGRLHVSTPPANAGRVQPSNQQVIIVNPGEHSTLEARRKSLAQEHSYAH